MKKMMVMVVGYLGIAHSLPYYPSILTHFSISFFAHLLFYSTSTATFGKAYQISYFCKNKILFTPPLQKIYTHFSS